MYIKQSLQDTLRNKNPNEIVRLTTTSRVDSHLLGCVCICGWYY